MIRDYPAQSCGVNVATMSFDDKFGAALEIALKSGLIIEAARDVVLQMVASTAVMVAVLAGIKAAIVAFGAGSGAIAGPVGVAAVGTFAADLAITWYRVRDAIMNADNCYDLEQAAPPVAEFIAKAALAGLLLQAWVAATAKPSGRALPAGTPRPKPKIPPVNNSTGKPPDTQAKPNWAHHPTSKQRVIY